MLSTNMAESKIWIKVSVKAKKKDVLHTTYSHPGSQALYLEDSRLLKGLG